MAAAVLLVSALAGRAGADCPKRPPCPKQCVLDAARATCVDRPAAPRRDPGRRVPAERAVEPAHIDVRADADRSLEGAVLWLDGEEQGRAPRRLAVAPGRHLVELKRPGYQDYAQWVTVAAEETVIVTPVLKLVLGEAAARLERECRDGTAKSCFDLARDFDTGDGVPIDDARAAALYQRGCDLGDPMACNNLGAMLETGEGIPVDLPRARDLFRRACDAGNPRGCMNLGELFETGRGVARDDGKAVELYRRGCDGTSTVGCVNLGVMIEKGRGAPRDDGKAVELYRRGCEAGE